MRNLLYRCILFSIFAAIFFATSLSAQWAYGTGSSGGNERVSGIAYDASGNVYITGYFSGTVDFNPGAGTSNLTSNGSDDIYIAKYNSSGVFQWANNFGGSSSDKAYAIKVDGSSNVFIVGYFIGTVDFDPSGATVNLSSANLTVGDGFFAKYSSSGTYMMAKNFGGSGLEEPNALVLSGGNFYITGIFRGTADFDPDAGTTELTSAGGTEIFIAGYSSTGALVFAKGIGSTSNDAGNGIGIDGGVGQIVITGSYNGTVDFDPSGSTTNVTSNGGSDIFVAAYDNTGAFQWVKSYGGTSSDEGNGIAVDENNGGDFYVIGNYEGTVDFDPGAGTNNLTSTGSSTDVFFAKYNSTGGYSFAKSVGSNLADDGTSIAFDASSNIYITGNFLGVGLDLDPGAGTTSYTSIGGTDLFYAKYNSSGAIQWSNGTGSSSSESALCVAVDGSGNVFVGGYFSGTVDFDPGAGTNNLISAGSFDLFFTKYNSNGTLPVELTNFTASKQRGFVELLWKTATEVNNFGFEIERRITHVAQENSGANIAWKKIGFVEGSGTTNAAKEYSFRDNTISSGYCSYRLKQIDHDGKYEYSQEVEVKVVKDVSKSFTLGQNYPNPFNPSTTIGFTLQAPGFTTLMIYDAIGREVTTLTSEYLEAGVYYEKLFDASSFPSGIYVAKLQSGSNIQLRKMILMK